MRPKKNFSEIPLDKRRLKITEIGIPSGIQYAIVSFSNLFVWRYISSFESAAAIAGIGVAQRLDRFVTLPCHGFGTTVTTCVGQNMGAKNDRRAKLGARWSFLLALIVVLVMSILIYIFAEPLVAIFNSEHDVVEVGSTMIRILAPFFWMSAIREVVSGILRAYGHARAATVLTVTGLVVVRQIHLYYALRASHSLFIIYNNWPITWTITTALLTLYYGWMLLRHKL
ncbi:MAG: hypothetical protein IJT18_04790 [Oscillospiraceae bacterium]|nr:hypothetical protein [Oscillospiraceae bacterium]